MTFLAHLFVRLLRHPLVQAELRAAVAAAHAEQIKTAQIGFFERLQVDTTRAIARSSTYGEC